MCIIKVGNIVSAIIDILLLGRGKDIAGWIAIKVFNNETYHLLLNGKKEYINDMFKNIDDMIDDLYDHDTKDIFDMGLNEYSSYEDLVTKSFGNGK